MEFHRRQDRHLSDFMPVFGMYHVVKAKQLELPVAMMHSVAANPGAPIEHPPTQLPMTPPLSQPHPQLSPSPSVRGGASPASQPLRPLPLASPAPMALIGVRQPDPTPGMNSCTRPLRFNIMATSLI